MNILLAKDDINGKAKSIDVKKLEDELEKENGQKVFYFDKENSHKSMMDLVEYFEKKNHSVYFREVKFGLSENDYMYEVHVL